MQIISIARVLEHIYKRKYFYNNNNNNNNKNDFK